MMDFKILDNIDNAYKKAKELDIFNNIFKIGDFALHPRRFWHQYNELSFKSKVMQFLTYVALYVFALWLLPYKNLSFEELLGYVIIQVVAVIAYAVVAFVANFVFGKGKGLFKFVLILCFYVKFIGGFIHLVLLKGYYAYENPLLLSLAVVVPLALELLNFIYASIVWQKVKYKVVVSFMISLMLLNAYDYFKIKTKWDIGYNPYHQNFIETELGKQANSLNYFCDVPRYVSYDKNGDAEGIVVYDIRKSLNPSKKIDLKIYNTKLKEDIDSLRVIINRCQFKMNMELFQDILEVKKDILTINESGSFSEAPMIYSGHLLSHDRSIECYAIKDYDRDLVEHYIYAFEK